MVGPDKGDGSLEAARRLAADLGVADHVEFRAAVAKRDVPNVLASAGDIFLNTADIDNTPVSVLEAMATGLCVVSTRVGGIPYLIDHETNGLLVPPRDPRAMAAAVLRVLDEPGLAERLSRGARRKAERFDWSPIVLQWRSLLAAAAERRPPGR
jgi:glycosyltransferase involved in cell wall biosynthesis